MEIMVLKLYMCKLIQKMVSYKMKQLKKRVQLLTTVVCS